MARGRITRGLVDSVEAGEKDRYLWDDELAGFGMKVTPAGRRVYLVQYRVGGRKGRTRRVTVGTHGVLTPLEARQQAKTLLGEVHAGRDPASERHRNRDAETFGKALDRFLVAHVDAKLKPNTAKEYRRVVRLHVPSRLRSRSLVEIDRSDIARLHDRLSEKPYQANRLLAILSKFFNWSEAQGLRQDNSNPCRHVQKFPEKGRERHLSGDELQRLGQALQSAEVEGSASPWIIAAIRLLVFTGARHGEILALRWDQVDIAAQQIRLQDSKTGRKSIYLNPPAIAVLETIPKLEANPFVICGEKPGAHLVNLQKPWRRIRKAAALEDVRIHDLRHTFASWAAKGGLPLPIIGGLLSHSQPQTTQRYAHLSADPLKAAADQIGNSIADAMAKSN